MISSSSYFSQVVSWENLLLAWRKASRGKRSRATTGQFEHQIADRLLALQEELRSGSYRPGKYTHFYIHEPKRRLISAAPFRDRVVHHALCNVIEPEFERRFIGDSYANRLNKGTHRAIDRLQTFSRRYRYAIRLDIVRHFPSIDHQILFEGVSRVIQDEDILALISTILASGQGVLEQEYRMVWFPGDDLLAVCRPRGLPIGNLTSQFWSNCYLHPLDLFIKRELGCRAYLRYVDDFVLFSDSKRELWQWKKAIGERLASLRLTVHETSAQVTPTNQGIPWLGFVVYPEFRRIKGRKLRHTCRRLSERYDAWRSGSISFGKFDASVQGWINHVRYADSWGLREAVLSRFVWGPDDYTKRRGTRS
ncbi:MAG: reverse transcriptase domain-containing protein [Candidatus Thiodiazotropha taylori]